MVEGMSASVAHATDDSNHPYEAWDSASIGVPERVKRAGGPRITHLDSHKHKTRYRHNEEPGGSEPSSSLKAIQINRLTLYSRATGHIRTWMVRSGDHVRLKHTESAVMTYARKVSHMYRPWGGSSGGSAGLASKVGTRRIRMTMACPSLQTVHPWKSNRQSCKKILSAKSVMLLPVGTRSIYIVDSSSVSGCDHEQSSGRTRANHQERPGILIACEQDATPAPEKCAP